MSSNPWLCHEMGCAEWAVRPVGCLDYGDPKLRCAKHEIKEEVKEYANVICTNQGCMATYPGNHTACSVCGTPNECPRT